MAAPIRLRVVRSLVPVAAGPVFETVLEDDPENRTLLWPGVPPDQAIPEHPVLGRPGRRGFINGMPSWMESCPTGAFLSDLPLPLPPLDATRLVAQLADALDVLHRGGEAHGEVAAHRILIDEDGNPHLVGAGTVPEGTTHDDHAGLLALYASLCVTRPEVPSTDPATFATALEAWLGHQTTKPSILRRLTRKALTPVPEDARCVELTDAPWAVDEVGYDLGPDEGERGLLDPWTSPDITAFRSEEATGNLSAAIGPSAQTRAKLARLAGGMDRGAAPDRFFHAEGQPCVPVKRLIADEPLDPLPVPDGLPLPFPDWSLDRERTSDITSSGVGTMDDITAVSMTLDPEVTGTSESTGSESTGSKTTGAGTPGSESTGSESTGSKTTGAGTPGSETTGNESTSPSETSSGLRPEPSTKQTPPLPSPPEITETSWKTVQASAWVFALGLVLFIGTVVLIALTFLLPRT